MIKEIIIQNYKSIKDSLRISFEPEPIREFRDSNVHTDHNYNLDFLKSIAVFGPNASGKSNIVKALGFMRGFVLDSASNHRVNQEIFVEPFKLSLKTLTMPILFEISFVKNEKLYRYGFQLNKSRVLKEWLYHSLKTKEEIYFMRDGDHLELNNNFSEGWGKEKMVRPNALFLSTVAQLNGRICSDISDWFKNLIVLTDSNISQYINFTADLYQKNRFKKYLKELFRGADFDFDDIDIKQIKASENQLIFFKEEFRNVLSDQLKHQLEIQTKRFIRDKNDEIIDVATFDLIEESQGTQKFFSLAGPIINSLMNGYPLIIDEFDAKLHPSLSTFIVELFCHKTLNPHGAQLFFVSHMTNVLSSNLLRRDQIILVSKDRTHGTSVKRLYDEGIRKGSNFEKEYRNNEYGALPNTRMNQLDLPF